MASLKRTIGFHDVTDLSMDEKRGTSDGSRHDGSYDAKDALPFHVGETGGAVKHSIQVSSPHV